MSCSELRPLLSFFLEKETGPLETLEARRHLDRCDACGARADRMARLLRSVPRLLRPEAPRDVAPEVMSRLRAMKTGLVKGQGAALAAKWSGLVVLLAAGLSAAAASARVLAGRLGDPIAASAAFAAEGAAPDGVREVLGGAVPVAIRVLKGGAGAGLLDHADTGLAVAAQVFATGLSLAFLLAIPAAMATAWLLHRGSMPDAPRTR